MEVKYRVISYFVRLVLLLPSFVTGQDIIYPEIPSTCRLHSGDPGICRPIHSCLSVLDTLPVQRPVTCGFDGSSPIVCCPKPKDILVDSSVIHVIPPVVDFECGDSNPRFVTFSRGKRSAPVESVLGTITAVPPVAGGVDARLVLTKYMALLGDRDSSGTDWFCDGVLINEQWVLSAAHCFQQRTVNIVRLGEYDYNDFRDGANIQDIEVAEIISYPDYRFPEAYHDLALVKLKDSALLNQYINPVCLPWGQEAERNLVDQKITLTGWGAVEHGGYGSSVLQEVGVTVFHHSRCDQSYSLLPQYSRQWPKGIGNETLCAGDPQGGKDACQGDSGGPVVYLNEDQQYVLAGIVSKGYGCGLEEFPGLYVNMRQSPYLIWIKEVAFQELEKLETCCLL